MAVKPQIRYPVCSLRLSCSQIIVVVLICEKRLVIEKLVSSL